MVETIDKIRRKISKLLVRIAELENDVKRGKEKHYRFKYDLALKLIQKKDRIESDFQKNLAQANSDLEREIEKARFDSFHSSLIELLDELEVSQLASPLDTMADFIEVVGTVKSEKKRNGLVVEVVNPGYLIGEELIRPSQVIVVQND